MSSMGIRVDKESLAPPVGDLQRGRKKRTIFPQTLAKQRTASKYRGGIGQSRLCMFYLRKAHIGEIQASIWPEEMRREARAAGMYLI